MQITNIFIVLQKYLNLDIFNDAIFAMIEKFRKYWGEIPLIFYFGLIVDPRLKFEALDEWLTIIYFNDQIKIEEIKNEINSLYIIYITIIKKNMVIILIVLNYHLHLQALHLFIKEL